MKEIIELLIEGIMDAFEEFFSALTVPTTKFTFDAFIVSLGFLAFSIIAKLLNFFCIIDWPEAATCSIILFCIVLIDSTTRKSIKENLDKVKNAASKFSHSGEEQELEVDSDESGEE